MSGGRPVDTLVRMTTTVSAVVPAPSELSSPARDALRDIRDVSAGIVPFGLFLGITLTAYGEHPLGVLVGAAAVYGGSAQLATATVLHTGAGLLAAVLAGAVVNARLLLYGAALEDRFRDQPPWFRWLGPATLLDQTYLSALNRPAYRGAGFRRYWGSLGLGLLVVWLAAVAVGVAAGPLLPDLPHLVLVGAAMFLAMLLPRLVDRPSVVAALVGAAVSALAAYVVPEVAVLAGALAGVLAAVVANRGAPS
jgi:predicted branched-subunit amino acid permease